MQGQSQPRIVVGIDGSESSRSALQWARQEARRREALLEVVHCETATELANTAWRIVDRSVDRLLAQEGVGQEPGELIEQTTAEGRPGRTLCAIAKGADLLVVGTHGRGDLTGTVLGSVSRYCTTHATCPVVVVPRAVGDQLTQVAEAEPALSGRSQR